MLLNLFTKYDFYVKLRAMFVVLGLFHVLYLVLFIYINQSFLVLLNIFSIILYAACAYFARDLKTSARAIMAVRIEIFAHAFICALILGWDYGFQNIILGVMSIVFFSSLATKGVNNFFAYVQGTSPFCSFFLLLLKDLLL